jgi:hypothetical protein
MATPGKNKYVFRPYHKLDFALVLARHVHLNTTATEASEGCPFLAQMVRPWAHHAAIDVFAPHKTSNKLGVRPAQQFIQRPILLDGALVQYSSAVGHRKSLFQVMAHVDSSQTKLALNPQQLGTDILSGELVQGTHRLIQEQDLGAQDQSPGKGHPLPFPAA